MIVGVFFPFDGLIVMTMTIAYLLCPMKWLGQKYKHLKFFLITTSVYCLLFMAYRALFLMSSPEPVEEINFFERMFWLCILPFWAVCYWLCPMQWIDRKYEYLSFFLLTMGIYCIISVSLIFVFFRNIFLGIGTLNGNNTMFDVFWGGLSIPWICIAHLIYPFKTTKRNSHITFFSLFISIGLLCAYGGLIALVRLSGGM